MDVMEKNCAVNASAGFGKTQNLCGRILDMTLKSGKGKREFLKSMVAMTFTKAAAGEIYERTLTMLCERIENRGDSAARAELEETLKLLVELMPELRFCTIDSFMNSVVAACPFELGLPGGTELIDPGDERRITAGILRELFNDAGNPAFSAACREAMLGEEGKAVFDAAAELIGSMRQLYSRSGAEDDGVWRHFDRKPEFDRRKLEEALRCWREYRCSPEFSPGRGASQSNVEFFDSLLEKCGAISQETVFTSGELALLRGFFKDLNGTVMEVRENARGGFSMLVAVPGYSFLKTVPRTVRGQIKVLLEAAAKLLVYQAARRTDGIRKLFAGYCRLYQERVIADGRLAFADLYRIFSIPETPGRREEWVRDVEFRMNSKLRHWLIDEFQDTSREQLTVLNSMIDDVQEADRSLYIVGDVKQAIYNWRNGDRRLMELETRGYALAQQPLARSYRYGRNICTALNTLFSVKSLENADIPEVAAAWRAKDVWVEHLTAQTHADCFEAVQIVEQEKGGETMLFAHLIAERLAKMDVAKNGLRCGILARDNPTCHRLYNALVQIAPELADILVTEANATITGNKMVASLLALLVYVQHPADALAREAAYMSLPLRKAFAAPEDVRRLSGVISLAGMHGAILHILGGIDPGTLYDANGVSRTCNPYAGGDVDTLLEVARQYDSRSKMSRDAIDFREFASGFKSSSVASPYGKIRLMTIHHSKGLTFDATFVPLSSTAFNWRTPNANRLITGFSPDREPEWCVFSPKNEGKTNPELRKAINAAHHESVFEDLCVGYVATTRAKSYCCVLLPKPNDKKLHSKQARYRLDGNIDNYYLSDFIFEGLFRGGAPVEALETAGVAGRAERVVIGDEKWYEKCPPSRRADEQEPPPLVPAFSRADRLRRLAPSAKNADLEAMLALPEKDGGAALGDLVHEHLRFRGLAAAEGAVEQHISACRRNPEIVKIFDFSGEVWRERAYDVVNGNEWTSGRFDRVNITREDGAAASALIVDFKSDDVDEAAAGKRADEYRPQLERYRGDFAKLTGIPVERVEAAIIFTKIGRLEKIS